MGKSEKKEQKSIREIDLVKRQRFAAVEIEDIDPAVILFGGLVISFCGINLIIEIAEEFRPAFTIPKAFGFEAATPFIME